MKEKESVIQKMKEKESVIQKMNSPVFKLWVIRLFMIFLFTLFVLIFVTGTFKFEAADYKNPYSSG